MIASAASRVKEPRKTERRRKAALASGSRRSWLHSIVARSVRCRSGRSTAPPASSGSASSRRCSRATGGRSFARAAASSIASGRLSRRRPTAATVSSAARWRPAAAARLTKSSTAASSGKRVDRQLPLAAQVQQPARGGQHGHLADEKLVDDLAHTLQMLEVVEHQQHPPRREPAGEIIVGLQTDRLGHR